MNKKLLNTKEIEHICRNCASGTLSPDKGNILCYRKGIMLPDSVCGKFEYDPLSREPKRPLVKPDFSPEDFKL